MTTVALELAAFACDIKRVPESARHAAVRAVFDLVTAAVAGLYTQGGAAARRAAASTWGGGPASMWFSQECLTVPGAAFANSAIASMLDLDDGHRAAAGHPGAAVIPAVLATAELVGADAERLLTAIAIGYEIGVRVSAARDFNSLHTLDSGLWCGHGVAAAAGWLRGLPPDTIAHALAIAGTLAPSQSATAYTRLMGNNVKEGIPWATATALTAVDLAAAGFTGPFDLLDDETRYSRDVLTGSLGECWTIEGVYFKAYGCCRWAHAAIDGLLALKAKHGIAVGAITSIAIATFGRALSLNNDCAPKTLEGAQYSVPFCVALAAVRGPQALLPLDEKWLTDPEVIRVAQRVTLTVDPVLDAMFSKAVPARVIVTTDGGRFVESVLAPKGEPSNAMTSADLRVKLDAVVGARMGLNAAAILAEAVTALENGDVNLLKSALALPKHMPASTPQTTEPLAVNEAYG